MRGLATTPGPAQKERIFMEDKSQLKDSLLLIMGRNYVNAQFEHPSSPTIIMAVFRDITPDNGKPDFVMLQQPQGPWNKWMQDDTPNDPTDDVMQFDSQFDDILTETTKRVTHIQRALQAGKEPSEFWTGKIWKV